MNIVAYESDRFFDTIHVRVVASCVDYTVDLESGKKVSGSKQSESFTEYWSFLRRPGVKTLEKPGAVEGFCPNCGAQLQVSDRTECVSCNAMINSGEYDWVLSEITQASEWAFSPRRSIPGLPEMCDKDPAFNVQHIERCIPSPGRSLRTIISTSPAPSAQTMSTGPWHSIAMEASSSTM